MSQVIEEAHVLLQGRLTELEKEKAQIEVAMEALPTNGNRAKAAQPERRGPGRPRKNAATATASKQRRQRKGGTRADQAVALVEKQPGITASEIAKELKIKPNYLYRVLGELEKEGRVSKKGREYHPGK